MKEKQNSYDESRISRHYLRQIQKFDLLESQDEFKLAKDWQAGLDQKALQRLVGSHLRLVAKIADGYKGYGLPVADLISEGHIGMMQALKKYDPEKGFRLSTYAMWWIKAHIQQFVLNAWSIVKIGTTPQQRKLFFNLRRLKHKLGVAESIDLSAELSKEIASTLKVSEKDVLEMNQRLTQPDHSLNVPTAAEGEGDGEWMDMIVDEKEDHESALIYRDELEKRRRLLNETLGILNPRELDVFKKRRLQEPPETLDTLSINLGVSRERIRQIEVRAFEKLQVAMQNHHLFTASQVTTSHTSLMIGAMLLKSQIFHGNTFPIGFNL